MTAQAINNQIKDVVMPSPNAASLGKYGDIPVSYFTGVPNIGIPIHAVTEGTLSMSVSLSYHASGIKMAETASWVGMGFTLVAGGMITRTVQGLPDEHGRGYYTQNGNITTSNQNLYDASQGLVDAEPDIFNYNVNGISGKFYFDKNKSVQSVPLSDVKISESFVSNVFESFVLTTPDGSRYIFGKYGTTTAYENAETFPLNTLPSTRDKQYISSWLLLRVESYDGIHFINFEYAEQAEKYSYTNRASCKRAFTYNPGSTAIVTQVNTCNEGKIFRTNINSKRLFKIKSLTSTVTFNATTDRTDLDDFYDPDANNTTFKKQLDNIEIKVGNYTSNWHFSYDYFTDNTTGITPLPSYCQRLRLWKLQESTTGLTKPPYTFEYNQKDGENFIANRYTKAIDHWGFYNGVDLNNAQPINIPPTVFNTYTIGGSDRDSHESPMLYGALSKINYPTGGHSAFELEANKIPKPETVETPLWYSSTCNTAPIIGLNGLPWVTNDCCGGYPSLPYNSTPTSFTATELSDVPNAPAPRIRLTAYAIAPVNPPVSQNSPPCSLQTIVTIDVFNGPASNANRTKLGSLKIDINNGTNPLLRSGVVIDEPLTALYSGFQPNTPYHFELSSLNGRGDCKITKTLIQIIEAPVGGLRVKKITSHDGMSTTNDVIKTYKYKTSNDVFTGVLILKPKYAYELNGQVMNCSNYSVSPLTIYTFEDQSIVPLSSFEGYHIGYSEVTEKFNGGGSKKYTYNVFPISIDANIFPKPPVQLYKELGQMTYERTYKENSTVPAATNYFHAKNDDPFVQSLGNIFKIATIFQDQSTNGASTCLSISYAYNQYTLGTSVYRHDQIVGTVDGVETTTNYTYSSDVNQPLFPITTATTNSDGKTTTVANKYITHSDYINSSTASESMLAKRMKNLNIIANPIEVITKVGTSQVSGGKSEFSCFRVSTGLPTTDTVNNFPYPYKVYSLNKDISWKLNATVNRYDKGLPAQMTQAGYTASHNYTWDTYKRLTTKTFGTATPNLLTWTIDYHGASNLVSAITDENKLIKKFTYDGLMRLETVRDRMRADESDVQATTIYKYHFKGEPIPNNPTPDDVNRNFIGTISTFKGVTAPLSTKQYLDGLGRPIEVVKELYTPPTANNSAYWHQKNYVTYDALGRQSKSYLPFETATLGFENAPIYLNAAGYVETAYETSPLSRPISQKNADGTFTYMNYGANTAADAVQIMTPLTVSGVLASASSSNIYAANLLYKTMMTDENGKQTCVFKDKLGRVILTRKFLNGASGTNVDTYNVYDDYGQLAVVLPPASVVGSETVSILNDLTFQYKYDNKNRLIEKKIPGAESQRFYYDDRDLLTLTQDGNMGTPIYGGKLNRHLATEYDNIGRVSKTGWVITTDPVNFAKSGFTIANDTNKLTETIYYDNKSWVKHQGAKVLKPAGVTTPTEFLWSYTERRLNSLISAHKGNPGWMGKQHLRTQSVSPNPILDSDVTGVDWVVSSYNGMQQPNSTIRYVYADNGGDVRTWQNFTYDNARRLTDVKYNYALNGAGISEPTYTLSNMVYNHKDQLIEKNIGINWNGALQSIDYTYNIRGWLTNINNVALGGITTSIMTPPMIGSGTIQNLAITPYISQAIRESLKTGSTLTPPLGAGGTLLMNDNNPDLFSQNISYGNPATQTGAPPQYNGNIAATTWQVWGRDAQAYGFTYDGLDRLTEAKYFDFTGATSNPVYSTDNKFKEAVQYDLRGNILGLQRRGFKEGNWTQNGYVASGYSDIDLLRYSYNTKNQVINIYDGAFNFIGLNLGDKDFKGFVYNPSASLLDNNVTGGNHYAYDANGNLRADLHKDITLIEYNFLNLPQVITFTNGRTIKFVYDASGAKLRKITNDNGVETTYDYINGVEYKNGSLQRFAHTEGAVARNDYGAFEHNYVLRDHLGNARVTFTDGTNYGDPYSVFYDWYFDWNTFQYFEIHQYIDPNAGNTGLNDGVITAADIKQVNNYYAFGLNMEGNWQGGAQGANKYQYNEKQLNDDFGLNWNDYGARFYDAAVGRWNATDLLADKYRAYSPYNYCVNNPLIYTDPTGMAVESIEGGYRYTGDDAQRVYGFLNSKSNNYYLAVMPESSKDFAKTTNDNKKGASDREGWNVFAGKSLHELSNLMGVVANTIKNVVIESHGLVYINQGVQYDRAIMLNETTFKPDDGCLGTSDILSHIKNGKGGGYSSVLKNIMDKVEDGGNCIFMACNVGKGQNGKDFLKAASDLSGGRLNIFASPNDVGIRSVKSFNKVPDSSYGLMIAGNHIYNGIIPAWNSYNSTSGFNHYSTLLIQLSASSPIQLKP